VLAGFGRVLEGGKGVLCLGKKKKHVGVSKWCHLLGGKERVGKNDIQMKQSGEEVEEGEKSKIQKSKKAGERHTRGGG